MIKTRLTNADLTTAKRNAEISLFAGAAFQDDSKPVAVATPVASIGPAFLTAGKAIFTVSNPAGERYTFRVSKPDNFKGEYFGALLTGQDNLSDYTYMCMVNVETKSVRVTAKSRYLATSKPVRVLEFAIKVLMGSFRGTIPAGYRVQHEGRCGRCGRVLTVPSSIDAGIGPDCAEQMGL